MPRFHFSPRLRSLPSLRCCRWRLTRGRGSQKSTFDWATYNPGPYIGSKKGLLERNSRKDGMRHRRGSIGRLSTKALAKLLNAARGRFRARPRVPRPGRRINCNPLSRAMSIAPEWTALVTANDSKNRTVADLRQARRGDPRQKTDPHLSWCAPPAHLARACSEEGQKKKITPCCCSNAAGKDRADPRRRRMPGRVATDEGAGVKSRTRQLSCASPMPKLPGASSCARAVPE